MIETLALLFMMCSQPTTHNWDKCDIQIDYNEPYKRKTMRIVANNLCYEISASPGMHQEEDVYVQPCIAGVEDK